MTAGQRHESTRFESVMGSVAVKRRNGRMRCLPLRLAGDKAYSCPRIRRWLERRRIEPIIPMRSDESERDGGRTRFDKRAYRGRSIVECCVGRLKECRALGTRYDKLAVNYLATVKLAMIQRYLRVWDSSDRT